jgi:hypothetical protein
MDGQRDLSLTLRTSLDTHEGCTAFSWLPMGASFVDNSQTSFYAAFTAATSFVSDSLASPNNKIVL